MFRRLLMIVLVVAVLSVVAVTPAQAQNCVPICVGMHLHVTCGYPPNTSEPPHYTDLEFQFERLSTSPQTWTGTLNWISEAQPPWDTYGYILQNTLAGSYRVRWHEIYPDPSPPTWSAWLYGERSSPGLLLFTFYYYDATPCG